MEVGSHSPFQGVFPTQGSNLDLLHYRHSLPPLSHQGSLIILGLLKDGNEVIHADPEAEK